MRTQKKLLYSNENTYLYRQSQDESNILYFAEPSNGGASRYDIYLVYNKLHFGISRVVVHFQKLRGNEGKVFRR